jgi:hypothetical protein
VASACLDNHGPPQERNSHERRFVEDAGPEEGDDDYRKFELNESSYDILERSPPFDRGNSSVTQRGDLIESQ